MKEAVMYRLGRPSSYSYEVLWENHIAGGAEELYSPSRLSPVWYDGAEEFDWLPLLRAGTKELLSCVWGYVARHLGRSPAAILPEQTAGSQQ